MGLTSAPVKGRFAPSPTGRMHLGNVFSALISWLSARSRGGRWLLRIEDLDPQRSRTEYAMQIEDDLRWLGLDWDEGGTADEGDAGPYRQSLRGELYAAALERLRATGLTYPCTCRRADIMATQAPHQSDGRVIYAGTCRPASMPCVSAEPPVPHSTRIYVPDSEICFEDGVFGPQACNLAGQCGDFVLRRADGAWAYQLAVVVDDALMGVTEVVRGCDLMLSAAQQIYLYGLLGYEAPRFAHVPLLCAPDGRRLSKRDASLGMESMRRTHSPEEIIGLLAQLAGLREDAAPCTAASLLDSFDIARVVRREKIILTGLE
ncbi:MAG: tRNA glutamyl-Q(34) synthetase GluQRS [Muribaculaceae bacterium]|nr:tRNA glutamyl-Q(34) synthetase GluQRS [Muribaculaceae bacterium]